MHAGHPVADLVELLGHAVAREIDDVHVEDGCLGAALSVGGEVAVDVGGSAEAVYLRVSKRSLLDELCVAIALSMDI